MVKPSGLVRQRSGDADSARGRRRWPRTAAAVVVTVGCAAGFAIVLTSVSGRAPVVVASADIAAGQVIEAGDVTEAQMSAEDTVALIPAGEVTSVVGQVASVPIPAGAPLVAADVSEASAMPARGRVEASLALKPGQVPAGVAAGSSVALYLSPGKTTAASDGATSSGGDAEKVDAIVTDVTASDSTVIVTFDLPESQAGAVAGADAETVSLMRTSPRR